jgi:hypothetical protein
MKCFLQQAAHLPAVAQVLQQALALELDQDVNRINTGVDQVAEHEIDDAVAAAERHRRLGAFLGQRIEPGSLSARQHESQHAQIDVGLVQIKDGETSTCLLKLGQSE